WCPHNRSPRCKPISGRDIKYKKAAAINSGFFITKKCKKNQLEQAKATKLSYTRTRVWIKTVRFSLLQNHNQIISTLPPFLADRSSSQPFCTAQVFIPSKNSALHTNPSSVCFIRLFALQKKSLYSLQE
ncbi:MAG: hypothetical protein ACTH5B_19755, partial [Marinomonas sp.]|uniref:hypothetical protein n=1 Tax=Marinomonas sp. TaxID=1904862 RepID=UPI003F9EB2A2